MVMFMISAYITAGLLLLGAIIAGYIFVRLPFVRRLFLPTSLAAGLLLLVFGPEVAGKYFPSWQISGEFYDMWQVLPKYMITLVFAGLFLGKPILSIRKMWQLAGPQAAFGQTIAWGHYALAGLLTLLVLAPVFGASHITAALLEISFEGGHGTVAGMTPVFNDLDFESGRQIATGLATTSLMTALLVGIVLVNWGRRKGYLKTGNIIQLARNKVYYHRLLWEVRRKGVNLRRVLNVRSLTVHLMLLFASVGVGWLIHRGLLLFESVTWGRDGVNFFVYVPLFTFAMFGGMIVQFIWHKLGGKIIREVVEMITTVTLTLLIMAAIGTMSLEFLVNDIWVFALLYITGVAWVIFAFFAFGKRMFKRYWFQNSIVSFGQAMGMTATGLLFAQMVDPKNRTNTVDAFGYKQLMFEPFMGGGIVTALSMPLILLLGLPLFVTIAFGIMIFWMLYGLIYFGRRKS